MGELEQDGYVYPGQRIARNGTPNGHGQGMTLRDYFAGQALAGFCAGFTGANIDLSWFEQHGALNAYKVADAMIDARAAP